MTFLALAERVVKYEICQSPYPFYAIFEKYNSESCTFYTPVGELGMALHEMYVVYGLSWGEVPYEERYLHHIELNEMKRKHSDMYDTYW